MVKNILKSHVKNIIIVILAAVVSGFIYNQFSAYPMPYIYTPVQLESGMQLSLEEAGELFNKKQAVFIDARDKHYYRDGHIAGAYHVPYKATRKDKIERMLRFPKDKNIVIYCTDADCTLAERLAGELKFLGYRHIAVFSGGWEAWQQAQLPVESGL